jgi:cytidine deaminase
MAQERVAQMLAAARGAMARAYAPYSNFPVGAALLGANGRIYAGCNVENAAYPQGCCAETSAISAMVADGERRILAALVVGQGDALIAPCGGCRQRLNEFAAAETPVHLCGPSGLMQTVTMAELLPHAFGPQNLRSKP